MGDVTAVFEPDELTVNDRSLKPSRIRRPQNLILIAPENQRRLRNVGNLVAQKVVATALSKSNQRLTPSRVFEM